MRRSSALRAACAASLVVCALFTVQAGAAEPFGVDSAAPSQPAFSGTEQAVVARYWELGRVRPFLAGSLEAGYAYARPVFIAGFGRPFWQWLAVETYPLLSLRGLGHYAGFSGGVPGLTFRLGSRYFYPFSRTFLKPRSHYTRSDIDVLKGPRAEYQTFEGELNATMPLLSGSAFGSILAQRIQLVPEGYLLFEESLRVIAKPPWVFRARVGYLLAMGHASAIRVGVASDVIALPGRDELVIRGGLLGSVLVSADLEAQASFIPVLLSPDSLGLSGGDFGQLGVRFRWATGARPDPSRLRQAAEEKALQRRERRQPLD